MPLRYSIPFLFLATAPLGFVLGGPWSFLSLAVLPAGLGGLDLLLGFEHAPPGPEASLSHRLLPILYIPLLLALDVWAAVRIADPATPALDAIGLTISTGLNAGIFGMLAAHELVHSPDLRERALGLSMLASVGYMQFRIAHLHGHHLRAATPDDPATARRGEGAYRFILRSVTGQWREAWAFEAKRLNRKGRGVWSASNRLLGYLMIEAGVTAAAALLGWRALVFLVVQAVLAITLLELFNYIAHYGLQRRPMPGGALERLAARHSWNSSRRMNNWSLFNMGRHSDHHRHPTRRYQRLEPIPDSPELPSGYAGSILLALIPPLWRRVMDPRLDAWMQSPS
jgi:alkane 1-monooxygenase